MVNSFLFKGLALLTLCLFFVFDNIRLDIVLTHMNPEDRFPFHRFYVLLAVFLFLANTRLVANECLKNKSLLMLFLYIFVSMAWSSVPYGSFKTFFSQFTVMMVSIMVGLAYYENRRKIIKTLLVIFFIIVLLGMFASLFFPEIAVNTVSFGHPRWIGISDHPNEFGASALVLIWLASNYYYIGSSKKLMIIAIAMSYYAIIMADSITSFIVSVAVAFYIFYCYKISNFNILIKIFLFLFAILFFIAFISFYKSFPDLIGAALEAGGRNSTLTGRTKLWHKAIVSMRGHWLFGYGYDNLKQVTERQYKQMYQMSHIHNGYIELLLKGGIFGWVLLGIVIIRTIYYQFKIRKKHRHEFVLLSSGLVMIFVHNFSQGGNY